MPSEASSTGSVVVSVIVDVIHRPGPYDYLWPSELGDPPAVGCEVVVPLQSRRVNGWVVGRGGVGFHGELRPVLRSRRPAPPAGALYAALAAAQWFGCSPVYFLRRLLRPRVGGVAVPRFVEAHTPEFVSPNTVSVRLLWSALDHRGVDVAAGVVVARWPNRSGIVVVPTMRQAERLRAELSAQGISSGDPHSDWDLIATGRLKVAVGTRSAAFSPVPHPEFCLVVDPIDPSMREESVPYAEALELAKIRASVEGIEVTVVSATPPLGTVVGAKIERERSRPVAPLVLVDRRSLDPSRGVSGWLAEQIPLWRRRAESSKIAVVTPSSGVSGRVRCKRCDAVLRCSRCGGWLRPLHLEAGSPVPHREVERLRAASSIDALECGACREVVPARCECGGESLRVSGIGAAQFATELEGVLRVPVAVLGARDHTDASVVVGTVGLLDRIDSASGVVFIGLDRMVALNSLVGPPLRLYYLHRALGIAQRGVVAVLLDTLDDTFAQGLRTGDVASLYREELSLRRELGLPPAFTFATLRGVGARGAALAALAASDGALQLSELEDGTFVLTGSEEEMLHRLLRFTGARDVRIEYAPRQL
ncbi:MAG: primosomal protein N' family DNA-binding protein [Ferrimicrobium sp.]